MRIDIHSRGALIVLALLGPAPAAAQVSMPPPANPVTVCGTQAAPAASSYQLVFDGGAPEAVTVATPPDARCPSGSSGSFTVPASRFTLGDHTIRLIPTNAFGSNMASPAFPVAVGLAPGPFTVTAVLAAALEVLRAPTWHVRITGAPPAVEAPIVGA